MIEVKLYKKPGKALKIFALAIPLVIAGIWITSKASPGTFDYVMGWFCTCFFSLGILVGLFHTFDRRPQIIINENGIWDRTTRQDQVKWEQIVRAYPFRTFSQKFVSLAVDDTFIMKRKLYKWAAWLNEVIGAQKINLHMSQLNMDEQMMSGFIDEMIHAEKNSRKIIIRKYFPG